MLLVHRIDDSQGKHWTLLLLLLLGNLLREKAPPFDDIEIHHQGKTFNWKRSKRFTLGKTRQQRRNKEEEERLHISTRVDAVVMKGPHTRERFKRNIRGKRGNVGFQYLISSLVSTCDNPLMSNRCLLNVSGLISNSP